jgi:reductive dehalogenase
MQPFGRRLYQEAGYGEMVGFQKLDYAVRFGAWNVHLNFGFTELPHNNGLYSREGVSRRWRHWVEEGGKVEKSPEEMSLIVKTVARFYGADLVGICGLHPNWAYSHLYDKRTGEHEALEIPENCRNAIVLAVAMDYDAVGTSPSALEGAASGLGYSRMAYVANLLAVFIRHLGYEAIPSGNDMILNVPLAMAAGLGEPGRHGLLITKKFGPRVRLCNVLTDLPLSYDSYRPFGAAKFCETCKKCAIHCPSQAIPYGDMTIEGPTMSHHTGVRKWYVNCEKCFQFWSKIRNDCANCIRVCPFNKPIGWIHDVVRWTIKHIPRSNGIIVKMDDLLGYGKQVKPEKYWKKQKKGGCHESLS